MSDRTQSGIVLIGELARRSGVRISTIRFYERQGLLPEPQRSGSGYREYPIESISHVRFIRNAQDLGFTLKEIQVLLSLRSAPVRRCEEIREIAETKLALIRARIRSLQRMELTLSALSAACRAEGDAERCAIIEALDR